MDKRAFVHIDGHANFNLDVPTPIEAQRAIEKPAINHSGGDAAIDGHVPFPSEAQRDIEKHAHVFTFTGMQPFMVARPH